MESIVTISRYWSNPQIQTTVTEESIKLNISLDDFIAAIKQDIESVTWTFKQATFEKQLDEAVSSVLEKIKEESIKAV
jgi:hypothetical protein